jgi:hypothetical protein
VSEILKTCFFTFFEIPVDFSEPLGYSISTMNNEELQKKIENILNDSDIVWPRYGSQTIEQLAKKIVKEIAESLD